MRPLTRVRRAAEAARRAQQKLRDEVLAALAAGEAGKDVADAAGINRSTLHRWREGR